MAFTRAQASALLNKTEMRLFDDSRANALRGLDRAGLDTRIARTRDARDRARDLLKRQRGAARKSGAAGRDGVAERTARKEALLVEILERFTGARRDAPAAAKKTGARSAATGQSAAGQAAARKTAARKAGTKQPAESGTAARRAPVKKAAAKKAKTAKTATRRSRSRGDGLTPDRALEQTRRLLEAKKERDRSPQPWQALDPSSGHVPDAGFQSPEAARKAKDLHDAESRVPSIHGSISTRDRINQGKRDHRGDN